jgi:hypothetical protein
MITFVLKLAMVVCLVILAGIVLFKLFPFVLIALAIFGVLKLVHAFRGPRPPTPWH